MNGSTVKQDSFAKHMAQYQVPTYRNTSRSDWWALLNAECTKLGIAERTFGDVVGPYEMGESPETAAAHFKAMED
ncbi:hypothetical protein ACCZ74_12330 [Agrobacterium vitis]|uniref:hypothetical protein n=1 Tax=Agrobacterium vitis TaxID=373 RepID=UPI00403E864F